MAAWAPTPSPESDAEPQWVSAKSLNGTQVIEQFRHLCPDTLKRCKPSSG